MNNIKKCHIDEDVYPSLLRDIKKPPNTLFYRGDISILNNNKCIAVIGSRDCDKQGIQAASEAGAFLATHSAVVVNGLALGCDTYAIKMALDNGGKCAVVMPCGLEHIYPKSNTDIAKSVLDSGGCIISEYPPFMKPTKYTYVERDRLQSGISHGVIVVETQSDGGTMHTVRFAMRQNRRIAVYSALLMNMKSGNKLIEEKYNSLVIKNESDISQFLSNIDSDKAQGQLKLTWNP